jgi:sulfide dehydrogenase [flavocytochrome c] flavoprotein subunit
MPCSSTLAMLDPCTSQRDKSAELRAKQAGEARGWYIGMTADIFG